MDGREVASSRALLEQQLTCGKVEEPCLVMQKKKSKMLDGDNKRKKRYCMVKKSRH